MTKELEARMTSLERLVNDYIGMNLKNIAALEAEVASLKGQKPEPVAVGRWKPERNETYWLTASYGIDKSIWADDKFDRGRWELGNCYRTSADASYARERQVLLIEMRDWAAERNKGWVPDWDNFEQQKRWPRYDHNVKHWHSCRSNNLQLQFELPHLQSSDDCTEFLRHFGDRMHLILGDGK